MPAGHLVQLGRGLSSALEAIHAAGVVHRDLKPGNVLMLDGDPVVIDFGIAHVADDVRLTMTGLVMGTPGYLSPELVEGSAVTAATDWWGWAATLAFAASGQPPFGRGPTRRGDRPGTTRGGRPVRRRRAAAAAAAGGAVAAIPRPAPGRRRGAGGAGAVRARRRGDGRRPAGRLATPPTRPYAAPAVPGSTPRTVAPHRIRHPRPRRSAGGRAAVPPAPPGARPRARADDPLAIFRPPARRGCGAASRRSRGVPARCSRCLVASGRGRVGLADVTALVLAGLLVAGPDGGPARRRRPGGGTSAAARGSDPFVAAVSAPWHLFLRRPRQRAGAGAAGRARAQRGVLRRGGERLGLRSRRPVPDRGRRRRSRPPSGCSSRVLVAWWGPGGASVRRGSRGLVRGVVRGRPLTSGRGRALPGWRRGRGLSRLHPRAPGFLAAAPPAARDHPALTTLGSPEPVAAVPQETQNSLPSGSCITTP